MSTHRPLNRIAQIRRLRSATTPMVEQLESRRMLSVAPQVPGALNGKVVYTSGGHGFTWKNGSWQILRTYINGMMEDMGNQDQLDYFAQYLIRSGATVVSMRPLGHQVNEDLVDNADTYSAATGGFQVISGSWSGNTVTTPYWSDNNGNDTNHWMFAPTSLTETAVARFTANIPSGGFYPIYAWTNPGTNNANNDRVSDQIYRINYAGGSQEVKVAQNRTGNGWIYLGTYYFNAGVNPTSGSVEVSNKSATTGKYVVADGIRFGNGMGDWTENGTHAVSSQPREDESALYWCYNSRGWNGANNRVSTSVVYSGSSTDDETKNFSACDNFAAYMNNSGVGTMTDRLWISFHSNAGGGRGTVGLITGSATANQAWLANAAGSTVQTEMQALDSTHEAAWSLNNPPTFTGAYGEISTTYIGSEFDATIIEVAFHDNATDANLLKDPKVRSDVGRASYHTAIKYFDNFDASFTNTTYLPEPPTNLRTTTDGSGNVTLNWAAGPSSAGTTGPYGNAASGYRVWTSTNGYGFDLAATVGNVSSIVLPGLPLNAMTYFRVTAINGGGESLASWVAATKPQAGRRAPILIVNNFSRLDRTGDEIESEYFGTISRVRPRYNNTFDYVVQAGEAVESYNSALGVESCADADIASGAVTLGNYQTVIWMSGEQSSGNGTFTSVTQPKVTTYLNAGGKLFVSGSEIGWDLVAQAHGASFYQNSLHTSYVQDDAGTYATSAGVAGSALAGVSGLSFDNGTHGTYDVDFPDVISAGSGASVAMSYSGGAGGGAVVQYASGNTKIIDMAFPFESIYTPSQSNALMAAVLTYFGTNSTILSTMPSGLSLTAATDSGVSNSDQKTAFNNASPGSALQFLVSGTTPGATVTIFADGVAIGSAVAAAATTTVTTNGSSTLANGARSLTATQTESGKAASLATNALSVTIDTVWPTASLGSQTPTAGSATFDFTVTYADATTGLNTATFDGGDVTVSGPGGYLAAGSFVSAAGNVVTYRIPAPGGSWDLSDNGTYTVSQVSGQVGDIAGNARPAGTIGTVNATNPFAYMVGSTLFVDFDGSGQPVTLGRDVNNYAVTENGVTLTFSGVAAVTIHSTNGVDTVDFDDPPAAPITNSGGDGLESLDVISGTFVAAADLGITSPHLDVSVENGAVLQVQHAQHLRNLFIDGSVGLDAGGTNLLVVQSLTMTGTGILDMRDNDMVVNYSNVSPVGTWTGSVYNGITGRIAAGRSGGSLFGIVTSVGSPGLNPLGIAEASQALGISNAQTALFDGETVDATSVLVKFTYGGDANLDGKINVDDYTRIDFNVPLGVSGWFNGDFNLDGKINVDDYTIIDFNVGIQGPPL